VPQLVTFVSSEKFTKEHSLEAMAWQFIFSIQPDLEALTRQRFQEQCVLLCKQHLETVEPFPQALPVNTQAQLIHLLGLFHVLLVEQKNSPSHNSELQKSKLFILFRELYTKVSCRLFVPLEVVTLDKY
jgi:hypothetical protein